MTSSAKHVAEAQALRKRAGRLAEDIFRSLNIEENADGILRLLRRQREDDEKRSDKCPAE